MQETTKIAVRAQKIVREGKMVTLQSDTAAETALHAPIDDAEKDPEPVRKKVSVLRPGSVGTGLARPRPKTT